jgi:hypothetical protein
MTDLICVDVRLGPLSSTLRMPSPLRFMARYTAIGASPPIAGASCDYCGRSCQTILIAEVAGHWCERRFVRAPPGEVLSNENKQLTTEKA